MSIAEKMAMKGLGGFRKKLTKDLNAGETRLIQRQEELMGKLISQGEDMIDRLNWLMKTMQSQVDKQGIKLQDPCEQNNTK